MAGLFDTPSKTPEELEKEKQRLRLQNRLGIQPGELEPTAEVKAPPAETTEEVEDSEAPLPEEDSEEPSTGPGAEVKPPLLPGQVKKVGLPNKKDFEAKLTTDKERLATLGKISDKLPEDVKSTYQNKISDYERRIERAERLYNEREDRLNWAQTAQLLGNALTQLAAGYYGLKTGYDMSGVKFSQVDWEKKLDRTFDQYDRDTNRFVKQKESTESDFSRAQEKQAERAQQEKKDLQSKYEKEDEYQQRGKQKYAEQRLEAEKFNAEQENKTLLQNLKNDGKAATPKSTASEDRRQRDVLNMQEREVAKAEKLVGGDVPKMKKPEDKINSLRSFLKARGISTEEAKKLEESDDMLYTTDKERVQRLNSKASELLGQMKSDLKASQEGYVNRTPPKGNDNAAPKEQSTDGGKVRVRDKNGKEYKLPKAQLKEAISKGFTLVE